MDNGFYSIENLEMNSSDMIRNLDNKIQKINIQVEQLEAGISQGGWHIDQDSGKVERREKLKETLEVLEEEKKTLELGQGDGGTGSVLTVMLFGLAVRVEESRRELEGKKAEKDDYEFRIYEIDEECEQVRKQGMEIKKDINNLISEAESNTADLGFQLDKVMKRLHGLEDEKEDCQKKVDAFGNAEIGLQRRAADALGYAKKIIEGDKEALNNLPNYGEISQVAKCIEESASDLEQDNRLAKLIKDPLLPSEEDKNILSNIELRMGIVSDKLHEAIAKEKRVFEKGRSAESGDSQYSLIKTQISRMEEAVNNRGAVVPGELSIERCNQIIEAAKILQKLPDDFKDLRSAHKDIDNRALAFLEEVEPNIRQDPAVMQRAVQGLKEFAEGFRKLGPTVRVGRR